LENCLSPISIPEEPSQIIAGIVPHAGWIYSGPTAGKVFYTIKEKMQKRTLPSAPTFLIYGAVHIWGVPGPSLYSEGFWETPLGKVEVDRELAEQILLIENIPLSIKPEVHAREHSIEVEIPFIQYLFPESKILPIMVPPDNQAVPLGERIGTFLSTWQHPVVILGSTDLTHYGPGYGFTPAGVGSQTVAWSKENDQRMIQLALEMRSEEVIPEVRFHHNACGAGAIAATIATAKALGIKKGILLEHITSYEMIPDREAEDFVGYAGIVY
jgi:hypothetical protein